MQITFTISDEEGADLTTLAGEGNESEKVHEEFISRSMPELHNQAEQKRKEAREARNSALLGVYEQAEKAQQDRIDSVVNEVKAEVEAAKAALAEQNPIEP